MAHVPRTRIHAYQKRPISILIDIATGLTPGDLTGVIFKFGTVEKTGLTPQAGGQGLEIPVVLTSADLTVKPGRYEWECRATIAGEPTPLATGRFDVSPEPTTTP